MNKRPKSREETPKEGSDSARSATAPQQYATAPHKTQVFLSNFPSVFHGIANLQHSTFEPIYLAKSIP
jgi:hypothetical protein